MSKARSRLLSAIKHPCGSGKHPCGSVNILTAPLFGPRDTAGQAINEAVRPFGIEDGISWATRVKLLGLPGPSWAAIVVSPSDSCL